MTCLSRPALAACSLALTACLSGPACNPRELAEQRGGTQRLSIATGGTGGVYYPYGGGIAKIISEWIDGVDATAEVTSASVDNLKFIRDGQSDLAFTMADTLDDAVNARETFQDGAVPARALAVLYSNYTHLITLAGSGIERVADLSHRVVSTGSPSSGTEVIAFRILEAAGLDPRADTRSQSLGVTQSVDALKDGKVDAFFWSGGLPTAAVLDLASTPGMTMRLLPNGEVLPALGSRFGTSLYYPLVIPRDAYPGLGSDITVVGVANLLVVHERMSDDLAYNITRVLFEHQAELAAIHPQAKELRLESAVTGSPAPFHPGAIRYYRERNAWNPSP